MYVRGIHAMQKQLPALQSYGVMVLCIGLAMSLNYDVWHPIESETKLEFVVAIVISAWYGGLWPSLWCSLIAFLFTNYFIYEPRFEFTFTLHALVPLAVFLLIAFIINALKRELKRAETVTEEQRRWFEQVLSSIGDAVVATDGAGKVTYINTAAAELLGQSFEHIQGRDFNEWVDVKSQSLIHEVLKGNQGISRSVSTVLSKDGNEMPIEYTIAPIKEGQHKIQGVVLAIRDTTEREAARAKIFSYQEDLRSLASQVSLAEERERRRISVGLHDRVTQSLALTVIKLHSLRAKQDDPEAIAVFEEIGRILKEILTEIRSLTFELSPPILYEFGLEPALEWLCQHFQENHRLTCNFRVDGSAEVLQQDLRIALYQSVRELLTNVVKHARASRTSVVVDQSNDKIKVVVEDDGRGFDTAAEKSLSGQNQGFGLFSVREHIRYLGGSVTLTSTPSVGTLVSLLVPLPTRIGNVARS